MDRTFLLFKMEEKETEKSSLSKTLNSDYGQPPQGGAEGLPTRSFKDTLMGGGGTLIPQKEVEDLWETGKMTVSYVNGNRQLPKLFVDKSVT